MKEKTVRSVSEFVSLVSDISSQGFTFFRGQSRVKYKLLPSLLRVNDEGIRYFGDNCDKNFLASFKSKAMLYLNYYPQNDIEWMFMAQHYGIPTRLLDWSQSPLIALFFAVERSGYQYEGNDCPVVWCLDPIDLNKKVMYLGHRVDVPNLMENDNTLNNCIREYYGIGITKDEILYPLAISGPLNNSRINAQKGVFTLFPLNANPLESMEKADEYLFKINIDKDYIEDIKIELYNLGIKYSTVYPELSSLAKDIVFEYQI
ncbi:FRG domain-containing protein [Anoxybacillus rupiensis]|uniref:FRG domain-containing protein n=1 Tax=Anoxybacteroides rupiense TaxID=311460 RepID=UPI001BA4C04C|nr:FRG domain-containing protein [Anoxybacillus rupiensis]MBS2773022.1 FRG domain-containing protein [Anoxybacillus rupiensis]